MTSYAGPLGGKDEFTVTFGAGDVVLLLSSSSPNTLLVESSPNTLLTLDSTGFRSHVQHDCPDFSHYWGHDAVTAAADDRRPQFITGIDLSAQSGAVFGQRGANDLEHVRSLYDICGGVYLVPSSGAGRGRRGAAAKTGTGGSQRLHSDDFCV